MSGLHGSSVGYQHRGRYRNDGGGFHHYQGPGEVYHSGDSRRRRDSGPRVPRVCFNFTMTGSCHFAQKCRYEHSIRALGSMSRAHDDGIYAIACLPIGSGGDSIDMYSGGRDKKLKRWKLELIPSGSSQQAGASPPRGQCQMEVSSSLLPAEAMMGGGLVDSTPVVDGRKKNESSAAGLSAPPFFSIVELSSMDLSASVTCLIHAFDCLFCGLGDGTIHVFHVETGNSIVLTEHKAEIQSLVMVINVLISADWDGVVNFWKPMESGEMGFNRIHSVNVGQPVKCLICIETADLSGNPLRYLWCGGHQCISIIDLQSLQVIRTIQLPYALNDPSKPDICMTLIRYESVVYAQCLTGWLKSYDLSGNEMPFPPSSNIKPNSLGGACSCSGMITPDLGPVLVIGRKQGKLDFIRLSDMQIVSELQAHEQEVRCIQTVTHPAANIFVSVGFEGDLGIWTFSKSRAKMPQLLNNAHHQTSSSGPPHYNSPYAPRQQHHHHHR